MTARVSLAERDFLLIAQGLVGGRTLAEIEPALSSARPIERLGPTAMHVFRDTLAKGSVLTLLRSGGAKRKIWERELSPIAFSPYSFSLVAWLGSQPLGEQPLEKLSARPRTLGDELVAYRACALVAGTPFEAAVAAQTALRASPLAWLGFPAMLGRREPAAIDAGFFAPLIESSLLLDALGDDLALGWAALRPSESEPAHAALRVQSAFLDAVEASNAFAAASFFVEAGRRVLLTGAPPAAIAESYTRAIRGGTLAERTETARAAAALLTALVRLGRAHDELSLVRFFDEGYEKAQATLARWEPLGKPGFARASDVLSSLSRLPESCS